MVWTDARKEARQMVAHAINCPKSLKSQLRFASIQQLIIFVQKV